MSPIVCLTWLLLLAPPSEADLARAQDKVNEATRLFLDKNFEGALQALREAERFAQRAKDPGLVRIRFNIARTLEELDRPDDALIAYETYLEMPDDSHRKARAWKAVRGLEAQLFGSLRVTCAPDTAKLAVEGLKGPVACPLRRDRVRPGVYKVRVTHPDHHPFEQRVEIAAGQAAQIEAKLERRAGIAVDAFDAVEPARREQLNPWPWVMMGSGLAVTGAGVGLTLFAIDARDEAETLPPTSERADAVDRFEVGRGLGYGAYALGGALIVGGLVWWFLEPNVETQVSVGPGTVGWAW